MRYDINQYTQLGIGETVKADHFRVTSDGPSSVENHFVGTIVDDNADDIFLRSNIAKQSYASGSARSDATGRGRFDLIPYEAMLSLARRYEMGAVHFGDRNWEKGQPLSRLLSSMRRHSHQISYDFSEDHVGAVLWNAAAFVTMVERMRAGILPKELDDVGFFLNEEAQKQ